MLKVTGYSVPNLKRILRKVQLNDLLQDLQSQLVWGILDIFTWNHSSILFDQFSSFLKMLRFWSLERISYAIWELGLIKGFVLCFLILGPKSFKKLLKIY